MADHFYSKAAGLIGNGAISSITIATSTTAADPIEVRITDAAITRSQAAVFLRRIAELMDAASATDFIPSGQFLG